MRRPLAHVILTAAARPPAVFFTQPRFASVGDERARSDQTLCPKLSHMTIPASTETVSAPQLRSDVRGRDSMTKVWVCWHGELSCEQEIVLKPDASVSRLVQQACEVIDVRGDKPGELRCAVRPPGAPATCDADAALPVLRNRETLDSLTVAEGSVFVLVPRNAVIVSIGTKIERLRELFHRVQRHGGFHLHNEKADFRHRSMFDPHHYVPAGKDTIDFLLDPSIKILTVMGPAGSGKTVTANETVPRVLVEKEDAAHPVMVCSLLADGGDLGAQFQQGFRAMFEERMDQDGSCQFDEMTAVPEEHRFGTAVGVIDEVPADPVDVQAMFERFEAATPWAKVRLLVVAGTALSRLPEPRRSSVSQNGVAEVRLSRWEK